MSKASHSDELITRINHADINCQFVTSMLIPVNHEDCLDESLRTSIKGIGDYLTRVVGSVPIDLNITLQVYDKMSSVYPSPVTSYGPLYYEGQGQAMSESEEEG